jgi:probable HAF family extracellular repeat protein
LKGFCKLGFETISKFTFFVDPFALSWYLALFRHEGVFSVQLCQTLVSNGGLTPLFSHCFPSDRSDGTYHAFLYSNEIMNDLGDLGGKYSTSLSINNIDQMAANYQNADGASHALLYYHGSTTELGIFIGKINMVARDINSLGDIIVNSQYADGSWQASVYRNGKMYDLDITGKDPYALGINNAGQIIGYLTNQEGLQQGFLYDNGTISFIISPDVGGTIVSGINNNGDIIGCGGTTYGAFIYRNGKMTNLNDLITPELGRITAASGINDIGQIVATGLNTDSFPTVYLLTPIPEPSILYLLFSGLSGFYVFVFRKRVFRSNGVFHS